MDFWTRLIIAGMLMSRITLKVEGSKSNNKIVWTPWVGRSLSHNFPISVPTDSPSGLTAPPLPIYVQPMQHRVGLVASPSSWQRYPWMIKGPAPVQAPRTSSPSIFERLMSFIPTLLSFLGVGGNSKGQKSKQILDDVFRMFGIESSSLSVIAMNVLIFIAEKIASRFLPTDTNEIGDSRGFDSNVNWFGLNFPSQNKINAITKALNDNELTEKVINNIELSNGNNSVCLQKIVCKMTPVVRGMQRYLFGGEDTNELRSKAPSFWVSKLYKEWPSILEFKSSSDNCNRRFPKCSSY